MAELNFESGVVSYNINGKCEVEFNPTDSGFIKRLFTAFEALDKKQDAYKAEVKKAANKREIFDLADKIDAEMREIINEVFGFDVCAAVFEEMNVCALANGFPVWCNFMLAVMDEADTTFAREQKATNPRIQKYTAKYHK